MINARRIHHLGPYLLAFVLLLAQASAFAHAQSHHDTDLGESNPCVVCNIAQELQQGVSETICLEDAPQQVNPYSPQASSEPESSHHSHYSPRAPPSL